MFGCCYVMVVVTIFDNIIPVFEHSQNYSIMLDCWYGVMVGQTVENCKKLIKEIN